MIVACVALLLALGGTAMAASPVVKRALFADNAGKLGGKTPAAIIQQATSQASLHIAEQASQVPGPASTAAGLVAIKTAPWTGAAGSNNDFVVSCDAGQKVIGGGWEDPGGYAHAWDSRPTPDGAGWKMFLTLSNSAPGPQTGTLYAVCLK